MSIRPYRDIQRRKSRKIRVGSVEVGGDAPISVQSMTNTLTSDAAATIAQIRRLEDAGADIVRVSCPDEASTAALKTIARPSRLRFLPNTISITNAPSKRPKQAPRACASIPATSVRKSAFAKSCRRPKTTAAQSASV